MHALMQQKCLTYLVIFVIYELCNLYYMQQKPLNTGQKQCKKGFIP